MSITRVASRSPQSVTASQPAAQAASQPAAPPALQVLSDRNTPHAFSCRCGRPVFFRNSECLVCHTPVGYDSDGRRMLALEPADDDRLAPVVGVGGASSTLWWRAASPGVNLSLALGTPRFRRCSNLDLAAACNWLVAETDSFAGEPPLCRCCRLIRALPDMTQPDAGVWWHNIELAKRRLVASLIGLGLPVLSKEEDPARGLVFDLLRAAPGTPPVRTGCEDGVITLDVEEAEDAWRHQRRLAMGEPYRTLLGQLRHDSGHYYWQRLVAGGPWLKRVRAVFGDDRQDRLTALHRHGRDGPPADWGGRFVSSFASSHPLEDWAETWAYYLQLVEALGTARSFGVDGKRVELDGERFGTAAVSEADGPQAVEFLQLINSALELKGVLNALSRSMGVPDFDPFVLSAPVVRKLYLVHCVVSDARGSGGGQ